MTLTRFDRAAFLGSCTASRKPTVDNLISSIGFIANREDASTEITQGFIKLCTDAQAILRSSPPADGYAYCTRPHQLPLFGVNSAAPSYVTGVDGNTVTLAGLKITSKVVTVGATTRLNFVLDNALALASIGGTVAVTGSAIAGYNLEVSPTVGVDAVFCQFTSPAIVLQASSAGVVTDYSNANTICRMYSGNDEVDLSSLVIGIDTGYAMDLVSVNVLPEPAGFGILVEITGIANAEPDGYLILHVRNPGTADWYTCRVSVAKAYAGVTPAPTVLTHKVMTDVADPTPGYLDAKVGVGLTVDAAIHTIRIATNGVTRDLINANVAGDGLIYALGTGLNVNCETAMVEIVADAVRLTRLQEGSALLGIMARDGVNVNSGVASYIFGISSSVTANGSFITGNTNTITATSCFVSGNNNNASGIASTIVGKYNTATTNHSFIHGMHAGTWYLNSYSHAQNYSPDPAMVADPQRGSMQYSRTTLYKYTTNAAANECTFDGGVVAADNVLTIPVDCTIAFKIHLTGVNITGGGTSGTYYTYYEGMITNDSGAIVFNGVGPLQTIVNADAAWLALGTVDALAVVGTRLAIQVTGTAGNNIVWQAWVETIVLGYNAFTYVSV